MITVPASTIQVWLLQAASTFPFQGSWRIQRNTKGNGPAGRFGRLSHLRGKRARRNMGA